MTGTSHHQTGENEANFSLADIDRDLHHHAETDGRWRFHRDIIYQASPRAAQLRNRRFRAARHASVGLPYYIAISMR